MKKKSTDGKKRRVSVASTGPAIVFIFLALKMGTEATIALLNNSEMWDWKNGTMHPLGGFIYMGIFILMAIGCISVAIWPPTKADSHGKSESNKSSEPTPVEPGDHFKEQGGEAPF